MLRLLQEAAGAAWGYSMAAGTISTRGSPSCLQSLLLPTSLQQWHSLASGSSRAICSSAGAGQEQQPPSAASSPASAASTSSGNAAASSTAGRKDTQPVASPLASLQQTLEKLSKEAGLAPPQKGIPTRTWQWYDPHDEKEWQRRELRRHYPNAGYAHMQHVPTSMKKMDRILRVVRGLQFQDAMHQLKALPHKAARYAEQVLDYAADDAEEKGLQEDKLVVDTVYATKGTHYKKPEYRAKGRVNMLKSRTCHVRVLLRELPVPQYQGFQTQLLPPITLQPVSSSAPPPTQRPRMLPLRLTSTATGKTVSRRRML